MDIDERLFSLEAPAGYAMYGGHDGPVKPVDDMNGKMMGKTMSILRNCFEYMNDHDGKWPTRLDDLRAAGMDAKKLQTLLSAPESKDGKSAFLYRQPKAGESTSSSCTKRRRSAERASWSPATTTAMPNC
jgi:hypothetical protein